MAKSYPNRYKTLWEKEKLLVTSNFSFYHSVFKRLVSQGHQKVSLCGNGLMLPYPSCHKYRKMKYGKLTTSDWNNRAIEELFVYIYSEVPR